MSNDPAKPDFSDVKAGATTTPVKPVVPDFSDVKAGSSTAPATEQSYTVVAGDSLSKIAAGSEDGAKLDTAAKKLGLAPFKVEATEDQIAVANGRVIPSVSAWAFGGSKVGETSDLFDDDNGYYLGRLDSLQSGGDGNFDNVKDQVRAKVALELAT